MTDALKRDIDFLTSLAHSLANQDLNTWAPLRIVLLINKETTNL